MTTIRPNEYHTLQQKEDTRQAVLALLRGTVVSTGTMFQVLHQAMRHGLDELPELADRLSRETTSRRRQKLFEDLKQEHALVRDIRQMVPPDTLASIEERALNAKRPTFFKGTRADAEVIVVFLTAYNNFYLSNVTLVLPLLEQGYSVLLLKSEQHGWFLNGILGFGSNWGDSITGLKDFLSDRPGGYRIAGFSSGGYASLLAALSLSPSRYVGFSICADLEASSHRAPPPLFDVNVRDNTPVALHRNLIPEARETDTPLSLIAGELNAADTEHALAFQDVPTAQVRMLPDTGHLTVQTLFLQGEFFSTLTA